MCLGKPLWKRGLENIPVAIVVIPYYPLQATSQHCPVFLTGPTRLCWVQFPSVSSGILEKLLKRFQERLWQVKVYLMWFQLMDKQRGEKIGKGAKRGEVSGRHVPHPVSMALLFFFFSFILYWNPVSLYRVSLMKRIILIIKDFLKV